MLIEKRVHWEEVEAVELTRKNMCDVAKWCDGNTLNAEKIEIPETYGTGVNMTPVYIGDYVMKRPNGTFFSSYSSNAENWYNRNEKGELIDG